jgi:GTP-binding protein
VTGRQLRERLERELEVNVGLRVDWQSGEVSSTAGASSGTSFTVFGRGELHIAILLEQMRREGYELQVSQPHVIVKDVDGVKMEPYEEVVIDVPADAQGKVVEKLNRRRGMLMNLKEEHGHIRLIFEIPTRGLLGYRGQFIVDTKGEGIISSRFIEFRPYAGAIDHVMYGSMISMETGKVLAFSLDNLQQRGTLYIEPATEIYEGMVVGNTSKGEDLYVNPTKGKQLSNMRSSGSDDAIYLAAPFLLSIERALEVMQDDEYIEITPQSVRLRKKFLTKSARDKALRKQ